MSAGRKYILSFLVQADESRADFAEICNLESDAPFPTIQKGDLIDPRVWEGEPFEMYMRHFEYGDLLQADEIQHHIHRDKNGICGNHKITIFTKIVKK